MRLRLAAIVMCICASVAVPSWAHHAFSSEFDANKPVKLKGVITRIEWINPHSWIHVDVKEADGKVKALSDAMLAKIRATGGPPFNLSRAIHRKEHLDEIESALAK